MASYSSVEYYTATQTDTLDSIAAELYGSSFLASDLVSLNPQYAGCLAFDGGEELKVPVYDDDLTSASQTVAPWRAP